MENKAPYKSKTLWVNLLMAVAAFFPAAQAVIQNHPEAVMAGFGIINMVLRLVTKDKIGLES